MSEPFNGRSETIRKRGLASPPEAILLQTEVGRAVPAGRRPGDADPGGAPADGDRRRPVRPSDDVRLVRARIDPVHEAGELVRRPDRPRPDGDPVHAEVERDRARELQAGVDTPHEPSERVRRPDVAGADGERAEAFRPDWDPLRDRVRARIDLRDTVVPELDRPDAAASGGDGHRLDALHPAADPLVGSRVDPVDAQVGADHPDRIACHRDVLQQPGET